MSSIIQTSLPYAAIVFADIGLIQSHRGNMTEQLLTVSLYLNSIPILSIERAIQKIKNKIK